MFFFVYNRVMDKNTATHRYFHSFCVKPNIRFDTQMSDEDVILTLRAHPIVMVGWIFNSIALFIILFITNLFLPKVLVFNQILFVDIFGFFCILAYGFYNFLIWYYNIGIVTNRRIIDVDYEMAIYREVSEARLNNIEDITSKSGGFLESFFDFGDVFVQTAGTNENIEFENIPQPADAVRIISDLSGK